MTKSKNTANARINVAGDSGAIWRGKGSKADETRQKYGYVLQKKVCQSILGSSKGFFFGSFNVRFMKCNDFACACALCFYPLLDGTNTD